MSINQYIKSDELNVNWLKYGFRYLTGIIEEDIDTIISYLKNIRGYSDKDIIALTNAYYTPAGISY